MVEGERRGERTRVETNCEIHEVTRYPEVLTEMEM